MNFSRRFPRGAQLALAMSLSSVPAFAASSTWTGAGADSLWTSAGNWGTSGVPGGAAVITGSATGSEDVATFNFNLNTVVEVDAYRNIASLVFAPGADAYMLHTGTLALSGGGSIVVKGGVTQPQTIASPVLLVPAAATAVFSSDSVVDGAKLHFTGGITGQRATNNNTSITLDGIGEGVISSVIGNGSAGGKVSIAKRSGGNWTLSGANTFSGGIIAYNGKLVFDYAAQPSIASSAAPLTMAGGTFVIKGRDTGVTAQTLGNLALAENRGAGVIVVDKNGGAGTTLTLGNTWTRNSGSTLLFDLSSGGVVTSAPTTRESVITGSGTAGVFLIKDATGQVDYATLNASGQVVRLETKAAAVTTYGTGSALATSDKNYKIVADTALTDGSNTFGTLRIDASANPVTVNLGANNLLFGKATMLVDGAHAVRLESSGGMLGSGGIIVMNHNTATATIAARLGVATPTTVNFSGPGTTVLDFDNSGQTGNMVLQGSVVRLARSNSLTTGNLAIQNGAVLELGATDFTRAPGTTPNTATVQFNSGSGGFSAFGAPRTVNFAGGALTWSSGSFLLDGSILILGSRTSDNTITFANAINLADGNRVVHVNDGVNTGDIDAVLSGVVSSSNPVAGILTKTGPGTLALTAANTYAGGTNVLAGELIVGSGPIGSLSQTGVIYNAGTLSFNRTGFYTVGGAITGPGTVRQIGAGKTIYTGLNTYTGPTEVLNGTLAGSGASASAVTIHAATLAPGVNAGTFYAGSATFSPESVFEVEVDGESADKLRATDAITLAGALNVLPRVGGFTRPSYVIAEGASIAGKFSSVTYGYKVTYTATQAILTEIPTYYTWSDSWAPGQTEHEDYDRDGVTNGLEYFMGETGSGRTTMPVAVNTGGVVSITWPKGAEYRGEYGMDHLVQTSTNLQPEGQPGGWAPAPEGSVIETASSITCIFPANEPRYFARLKVIIPPDPVVPIVPPSKAPPTPKGFEMTANSASSITMTWYHSPSNDDDASEFHVFSSTTQSGVFTKIGTTIERKFVHTGLPSNTTRYYKVVAANVAGESAQSPAAPGFTIIPSDGSSLPVLIAKNMCVSMGQTILSNVAPSSGTLTKLVDGLDATSCTIAGACEVKIKLNPAISIDDAAYLMLNFRTDTTDNGGMPYNDNGRALKNYVIRKSADSTNGSDGTWTVAASGTNPYLDGVVVIPTPSGSPKPKWISIQNSGTLQLCRLEIFRAAPDGYRNDHWIFAGDSLVVQDMAGGTASAHSAWFSDLVRQRHPDRYPIMVKSAMGGEKNENTLGRMSNGLPIYSGANGTPTPTGTFLCWETGFNDVGDGGGLWQGPTFISQLSEAKTLTDSHGMFLVPVRIEFSTYGLNLDTLEPAGSLRRHTLGANLAGVDVFARANTPYAVDPATQLPYGDYWTYTRNNFATVLAEDGVHHTRAGTDGINTLWADVADKMVYLKQP